MPESVNFGGRSLPVLSEEERRIIVAAAAIASECVKQTQSEICADAQACLSMLLLDADEGWMIASLVDAGASAEQITAKLAEYLSGLHASATDAVSELQGGFAAQDIVNDIKNP